MDSDGYEKPVECLRENQGMQPWETRFTRHSTIEVNAEGNGKGKIVSALHEYAEIPEAVPAQSVRPEDEPALPSDPKPKPCCRNRLLTRCLLTMGLTITVALLLVFLLTATCV